MKMFSFTYVCVRHLLSSKIIINTNLIMRAWAGNLQVPYCFSDDYY